VRTVSAETTAAWTAACKIGATRPMVRVTIEKLNVGLVPYDLSTVRRVGTGTGTTVLPREEAGVFASAQFCWADTPKELPNVKSVHWSRSTDSDAASCEITLWNTDPLPLGQTPPDEWEFDILGAYTPSRGKTAEAQSRWGQTPNQWQDLLAPDRVIRTYEGYGFDATVAPGNDPNLYSSGVWLIDEVSFGADGTINITARDMMRLLMDHIAFPPVVPWEAYPLTWAWFRQVPNQAGTFPIGGWARPTYSTDSTQYYRRAGYPGCPGGAVGGHHGRHAFDGSSSTYWMTLSNAITHGHGWVQGSFPARTVGAVLVEPWNGPYTVFISLFSNGAWLGRPVIHTHPGDLNTGEAITVIYHGEIRKNQATTIRLPRTYTNVTKIRVTLIHNGTYGGDGQHVGVCSVSVCNGLNVVPNGSTHTEGDGGDYTSLVKMLLAWGGFFWTRTVNPGLNTHTQADGSQDTITPLTDDPIFPQGRIWGDLEMAGAGGKSDLAVDFFDKKPLSDIITQIREIVNFIFFVDEFGGAVWRSPNIWQVGNYVSGVDGGPNTGRTTNIVEISDDETLLGLTMKMSSRNVRERVVVGNAAGNVAGVAKGMFGATTGPFDSGQRRIAVWSDAGFTTANECQIMADLITVRQMFEWRTDTFTIPGYPRIQIDDQVRVFERTTSESFLHYVKGIESQIDIDEGRWVYNLNTHWLGEEPFVNWVFDPAKLGAETRAYLRALGKI
jgi:hypothetical protein